MPSITPTPSLIAVISLGQGYFLERPGSAASLGDLPGGEADPGAWMMGGGWGGCGVWTKDASRLGVPPPRRGSVPFPGAPMGSLVEDNYFHPTCSTSASALFRWISLPLDPTWWWEGGGGGRTDRIHDYRYLVSSGNMESISGTPKRPIPSAGGSSSRPAEPSSRGKSVFSLKSLGQVAGRYRWVLQN